MFLKLFKLYFRRRGVEIDWEERCLLSEQHEALTTKWVDQVRRFDYESKEARSLLTKMDALRERQYALAERLGISDHSAVIVAKRDNFGNFPLCPSWVMKQHVPPKAA